MALKLNLGCGTDIKEGFINIDKENDFNIECVKWPYEDNSVEFIWAHHILEHVYNLTYVMREMHRVCKNGAKIDVMVPLAHSLWDVANPEHVHRFNHRTFKCYCVDFESPDLSLPRLYKMVEQHIEREKDEWFEGIQWQVANLHVILEVVK